MQFKDSLQYSEMVDVEETAIIFSLASISSISPSATMLFIAFEVASEMMRTSVPFTVANHGREPIYQTLFGKLVQVTSKYILIKKFFL